MVLTKPYRECVYVLALATISTVKRKSPEGETKYGKRTIDEMRRRITSTSTLLKIIIYFYFLVYKTFFMVCASIRLLITPKHMVLMRTNQAQPPPND